MIIKPTLGFPPLHLCGSCSPASANAVAMMPVNCARWILISLGIRLTIATDKNQLKLFDGSNF
jgi:hypothetical protein